MNKSQLTKLVVLAPFFLSLTLFSGIASAVNTANCNPSVFANLPIPDNALSISIDAVTLMPATSTLPEYCDVKGHVLTSPPVTAVDKGIQFEVKMPTVWNSKFLMHGNPGNAGSINGATAQIIAPGVDGDKFTNGYGLTKGYTISATDTGHVGSSSIDATAFRNPDGTQNLDRIVNFGYRAVHITAITSKDIMKAYYQQSPVHSYFLGTSNGGRQGLMEAQRYPLDFDGILVGAPAWNLTGILAKFVVDQQAQYPTDAVNAVITPDKLAIIGSATMQKCDRADGIVDGIISAPISCNFNPLKDLAICPAGTNGTNCVTSQQADVLKTVYSPILTPYVFNEGYLPGYENSVEVLGEHYGRPGLLGTVPDLDYAFIAGGLRYIAYNDPSYDLHSFNLNTNSKDLVISPSGVPYGQIADADNGNLRAFQNNGGKMIIVHGLADNVITPVSSIEYYLRVVLGSGLGNTFDSVRLYLMPGAFHFTTFSIGYDPAAPTKIDALSALDNWVVNDVAPDALIASRFNSSGVVDMTRPICAFPKRAVLIKAKGSIMDASNFKCSY